MKAIKSILLVLIICAAGSSRAQGIKSLSINDTLPDVKVSQLLGSGETETSTRHLYQKGALIINFWATWCAPCVKELEALAMEIEAHQDKLRVLAVSYESRATVVNFLLQHPAIARSNIDIITDDQLFVKMFFHQALPHNIWVNHNGVIKAITDDEEITAVNLNRFLTNSDNTMRVKKETRFDINAPLHIADSLLEFRSIFSRRLAGVELSGSAFSHSESRFLEFNSRIIAMFYDAYQMPKGGFDMMQYLTEVHTADSSRFYWPGSGKRPQGYSGVSQDEWGRNNTYSYEFRAGRKIDDSLFTSHVVSDLELNLGVKSYKTMKKRFCWVVTGDHQNAALKQSATDEKPFIKIVNNQVIVRHMTMDLFLHWATVICAKGKRIQPYLNRTKVDYPMSFTLDLGPDPSKYTSQDHLDQCVTAQLGLKFELRQELFPILVIEDRKKSL
jgi:thiol-disulfide isomerase/thioredoxin